MAEEIHVSGSLGKAEKYQELLPQVKALVKAESDLVANLANISAALKQVLGFFWVGFYLVKGDELVLGPFQGPVACTRIRKGKGVCGSCWEKQETILVDDVEKFPGHIACNALSRSEIVVPVFTESGEVAMVLDVDSEHLANFDQTDRHYLELMVDLIPGFTGKRQHGPQKTV